MSRNEKMLGYSVVLIVMWCCIPLMCVFGDSLKPPEPTPTQTSTPHPTQTPLPTSTPTQTPLPTSTPTPSPVSVELRGTIVKNTFPAEPMSQEPKEPFDDLIIEDFDLRIRLLVPETLLIKTFVRSGTGECSLFWPSQCDGKASIEISTSTGLDRQSYTVQAGDVITYTTGDSTYEITITSAIIYYEYIVFADEDTMVLNLIIEKIK